MLTTVAGATKLLTLTVAKDAVDKTNAALKNAPGDKVFYFFTLMVDSA